jgi:hypothetical protein
MVFNHVALELDKEILEISHFTVSLVLAKLEYLSTIAHTALSQGTLRLEAATFKVKC